MTDLKKIVELFAIEGEVKEIKPLGNGLINDTYKVVTEGGAPDYVLQRINNAIFTDVDLLQGNIEAVTRHIRKKLEAEGAEDIDRKVLRFIPLRSEGEKVEVLMSEKPKTYCLEDGKFWRVSVFINDAYTYETVNPEYSEYAGEAFGNFEAMLADIPDTLGETIPDFHNMELRLRQLVEAVREDRAGRLHADDKTGDQELHRILEDIDKYGVQMCKAEQLHREGKLPKRICHCDTKVNNMMFDKDGKILCVIDLDTVMPSYVFSDFGDFLRTAANPVAEDSPELEKVDFDMEIFKARKRLSERHETVPDPGREGESAVRRLPVPVYAGRPLLRRLHKRRHLLQNQVPGAQSRPHTQPDETLPLRPRQGTGDVIIH